MLTMRQLPGRNLRAYPARTGVLVVFALLMATVVFGGATLVEGIRQGLATVEARLGADILVTPGDADNQFSAQTFLLEAEPGYFYMGADTLGKVGAVEGVEAASPQLFLSSARASCCSGRYQVFAFDPATDFVVQPWIAETTGRPDIGDQDVVVGANVTVPEDGRFEIYGIRLQAVGQFEATGSTLDNAVYANFSTGRTLIEASVRKGLNKYHDVDPRGVISAVMVDVAPDADIEVVAERIRQHVTGVSVATAKNMVTGISDTIGRTSHTIWVFMVVIWAIGAAMTVLVFTAMIHERRREFAALKGMGATRTQLARMVVTEALMVDGAGALVGIAMTAVVLGAFQTLVGQTLGIGFLLPSPPMWVALALGALGSVLAAAALASWLSLRRIDRWDAGTVLKEGE
ncbi:ABC transporter permease [Schaalia sp. 19OD2882]|uniref:ABC transporter permease n=1 Tax=Schaalia sp. 19OD2882 TaxID=2794089 RepID=UPI001C1ED026|nr:ABC transporter permease [Schaalia sp. 19OD2882]QWW19840.1 ABC transporter permease [Schaalia sp. 19OD2882]